MSEEKMRDEFDSWIEQQGMNTMKDGETYYHHVTHVAWQAWKASRAAPDVAAEQLQVRCETRDLRVRAEAINQAINNYFNTDSGPHGLKENLEWQAHRLRERAGEEEQSK